MPVRVWPDVGVSANGPVQPAAVRVTGQRQRCARVPPRLFCSGWYNGYTLTCTQATKLESLGAGSVHAASHPSPPRICTGTGLARTALARATFEPGLGSLLLHLHLGWAHFAPHLHWDCAHVLSHLHRDWDLGLTPCHICLVTRPSREYTSAHAPAHAGVPEDEALLASKPSEAPSLSAFRELFRSKLFWR